MILAHTLRAAAVEVGYRTEDRVTQTPGVREPGAVFDLVDPDGRILTVRVNTKVPPP